MEKWIGRYRKGNPNDSFGFINCTKVSNLFIHDKEFNDNINRLGGKDVYVTFRIRPSKIKKGNDEGYDGCSVEKETDIDFLLTALNKSISFLGSGGNSAIQSDICKVIISRLANIKVSISRVEIFKQYFEENSLNDIIKNKLGTLKYEVMIFGLQNFYPDYFEKYVHDLNKQQEEELLSLMGFEGVEKYEALTHLFFKDFIQFKKYFKKFPNNVNKQFIYKLIFESENLPFDKSFYSIKSFVELIKANSSIINEEDGLRLFCSLSTPKIRLYLWLHNVIDTFSFDEYKENVWKLDRKDQSRFIKKIFYWKYKGKIELTVSNLEDIKVFNIDYFRQIKANNPNIDYINLDFNVSLLIYIIRAITEAQRFKENIFEKIFEHFLDYVQDHNEIQLIDFFYPMCKGRTKGDKRIVEISEVNDLGEQVKKEKVKFDYYHNEDDKPPHHKFCDGQLDTNNDLGYPENKKYSWCAGTPCFDPSNNTNFFGSDYNDWTIIEFLNILNIEYKVDSLSYLLGYTNKANLLIDRLKCNGCNSLLSPTHPNKYTYHVVNNFHCSNATCTEYNKTVYLNHCFNKNCKNVIDSRVSSKCNHAGYDVSCGWYICDFCYSCCSSLKIKRIIDGKVSRGLSYSCSPIGHDESKMTFCYYCGGTMKFNVDFYRRQQELVKSAMDPKYLYFVKSKANNKGLWRFTLDFNALIPIQRETGITQFELAGFTITETSKKKVYYVNQLKSIALKCNNKNCPNEEVFSPMNRGKWKVFKDSRMYLYTAVEKYIETGDIKFFESTEDGE